MFTSTFRKIKKIKILRNPVSLVIFSSCDSCDFGHSNESDDSNQLEFGDETEEFADSGNSHLSLNFGNCFEFNEYGYSDYSDYWQFCHSVIIIHHYLKTPAIVPDGVT